MNKPVMRWQCNLHRFEFKVEDMWIGVFWRRTVLTDTPEAFMEAMDVWLCLLPMVPLHLQFNRGWVRF